MTNTTLAPWPIRPSPMISRDSLRCSTRYVPMPNSAAAVNAISTLTLEALTGAPRAARRRPAAGDVGVGPVGSGSSPNDSNTIIARPITARYTPMSKTSADVTLTRPEQRAGRTCDEPVSSTSPPSSSGTIAVDDRDQQAGAEHHPRLAARQPPHLARGRRRRSAARPRRRRRCRRRTRRRAGCARRTAATASRPSRRRTRCAPTRRSSRGG